MGKARRRCVRSGNIWRNIAEILRDYVVGIYNLETIELFCFISIMKIIKLVGIYEMR